MLTYFQLVVPLLGSPSPPAPAPGAAQTLVEREHTATIQPLASRAPTEADEEDTSALLSGDELRRRDIPSGQLELDEHDRLLRVLTGWGGLRRRLLDLGLDIEFIYSADGSVLVSDGPSEQEGSLRGLLDVALTYDTGPTLGYEGGTVHVGLQWLHGVDGSIRIGVQQPISNIDADRRLQVGRLWYEQAFESAGTRVRLGKIDANSLFAYVDSGAGFLHSSMGLSPTLFLMPTYPDSAFGATIVQRAGLLGLQVGAFDGSFASGTKTGQRGASTLFDSEGGTFYIAELNAEWDSGRAAIGAWSSTAALERFDGGLQDGTEGLYALAEQALWRKDGAGSESIGAFLQLGEADGDVSPFTTHLGVGISWNDPESVHAPQFGIGISRAGLSDEPGAGFSAGAETAVELFYGYEPVPWVRLKPDVQVVLDPGGDAERDPAWIAMLRVTLAL